MHCNQILKLINTLLWITNLDAPKVAFEKEPYKVINWKFSGESQIFQLFALSSFLFLSSLEKRNRNALVLIVSWKFQDLNYSKVFIFCPFDSSLVYSSLLWMLFSPMILYRPRYISLQLYLNWRLQNAFRSAYLIFNACDRHRCKCFYYIAWGAFAYESFQWNLIGWIEYPFKNIISVY